MKQQIVLLLCLGTWGVTAKVDHAELRGEHSKKEDIDNGQCVPIPCLGQDPPQECIKRCDSKNYQAICQPPAYYCLCHHIVDGKDELVSPDEVDDQPPDSPDISVNAESSNVGNQELSPDDKSQKNPENNKENKDERIVSFKIFAIFLPIKQYLYESLNEEDPTPEFTADAHSLGYETVNVHEGRLFWDFRYILTGLLLLMVGLVVYELAMCALQVYGPKHVSIKCEIPEVKIKPAFIEKEKILNV